MVDIDNMTIGQLKEHFVERVASYHEGCPSGKEDFLRYCGLNVPTREIAVTVTAVIEVSGLSDVDEYCVAEAVREAAEDNLYIYDGDGNSVDFSSSFSTNY